MGAYRSEADLKEYPAGAERSVVSGTQAGVAAQVGFGSPSTRA
jgi:hypothetical protein